MNYFPSSKFGIFRPKNNSKTYGYSLGKGKKLKPASDAALGHLLSGSDRPEGQVSSRSYVLAAPPNHAASQASKHALFMRITPLGAHRPFLQRVCPRQKAAVNSVHWHSAVMALWSASQLLAFTQLSKQNPGTNK